MANRLRARHLQGEAVVRNFSCHPLGYYWVLVVTLLLVLIWNGFCLLDLRFLSDREFIDAAVRDVLTSTAIIETPTGGFAQFVPEEPRVPYGSLAEFHRLNPNCCKIVPHDPFWVGFWHRVTGLAAKSVHVRYGVRYVNQYGSISSMEAVGQRAVSCCGHVLNVGH
jgi:hypothetical protein